MLVKFITFLIVVCSASSVPVRNAWPPFMSPFLPFGGAFSSAGGAFGGPGGAFAGPGGAFAGPGGAFASAGVPLYFPYPMYIPMPDFSQFIPWYKGDNVCNVTKASEMSKEADDWFYEEFDDSDFDYSHQSQNCRGDNERYVCKRKIETPEGSKMEMIKYFCCHGFVRPPYYVPGCVEIDLRYLMPTLRNMGASELVKIIEKVGMADDFHNNNYTVFCPPNYALETMQRELEDETDNDVTIKLNQQKVKKKTRLYNIVTTHLSPGFFKTDNLGDGKILQTDSPGCKIRINVYFTPLRVITANCVPVMSENHFARNGVIHVVEKLLPMPSKTVADIIAGDTQFSILKRMLSLAGLVQTLRNPNGTYTLFAPTDSAFKSDLSYQNGESESRCTVSIMKHHIIDHIICSAAIPQHIRSLNMIGELLTVSRDQNNKLYVDDVQVVVRDLMATNGVVHIIDGILSTRKTKPLSQVLEESGLYEFLFLLENSNLKSEFDSLENVTFFVPTDEVFQSIPPRHLNALLNYNNQSIQNVLRFHVVEGQTELSTTDNLLHSKLENSTIRFQVHTKYPQMIPQVLAQCASVLSADIKLCGGTLHIVDKLLLPPKLTITEFLESIEGFSTLVLLLRTTGLDRRLNNERSSFTLFAPTDDAFYEMGEETIFRILEDNQRATDLIKMHIMLGSVCCTQLNNDMVSRRPQARTMDGTLLNLDRSVDNILMIGGAHIVDCDIMTTNGVIHMVDAVLSHDETSFLGGGFLDNLFIFV